MGRILFLLPALMHRIRRDNFRASTVSMFIKYKDFSVVQKQCRTEQPTDVTAVILNEARRLLAEVWDRSYDEKLASNKNTSRL